MQEIAPQSVSAEPDTQFQDVQHLSSSFQFVGNVVDPVILLEAQQNFFGVHFPELGPNREPLFSHFSIFNTETGEVVQRYQLPSCTPRGLVHAEGDGFFMYDEEGSFFHLHPGQDDYTMSNTSPANTQIVGAVYSRFDHEIYGTGQFENGKRGGFVFNWSSEAGLRTLRIFGSKSQPPYLLEGSDGSLCGVVSSSNEYPQGCFIQIDEQKVIHEIFAFPDFLPGDKYIIEGADDQFYGVATDFSTKNSQIFKLDSQGVITILVKSSSATQLKPLSCDGQFLYLMAERNRYRKEFIELNLTTLKIRKFSLEAPSGRLHRIVKQNNEFLTFPLQPSFEVGKPQPITLLDQPGMPLVPFVRGIL
jgi:hypothetical protein